MHACVHVCRNVYTHVFFVCVLHEFQNTRTSHHGIYINVYIYIYIFIFIFIFIHVHFYAYICFLTGMSEHKRILIARAPSRDFLSLAPVRTEWLEGQHAKASGQKGSEEVPTQRVQICCQYFT